MQMTYEEILVHFKDYIVEKYILNWSKIYIIQQCYYEILVYFLNTIIPINNNLYKTKKIGLEYFVYLYLLFNIIINLKVKTTPKIKSQTRP